MSKEISPDMDKAMAIARKFGYRFRNVTLDGQVLNAGGSMTGGSVSRSAGILSRANELEALNSQKDGLMEDLKAAAAELANVQRELTAANYELDTATAQLREAEDAVLMYSERADSASALLADLSLRHEAMKAEREQVRRRMEENSAATVREVPNREAPRMVEPDREVPGISASIWNAPMPSARL